MSHEFEIQYVEAVPTISLRKTVPVETIAQAIGEMYGRLAAFVAANGIELADAPYARYHACTEDGFDLEAGFQLVEPAQGEGDIVACELPGGRAAVTMHVGPYHQLGAAHEAGGAWVSQQGLEDAGPPWEVYVSDPGNTPEGELQTRVLRPLKD